jgi:hypothetical protein
MPCERLAASGDAVGLTMSKSRPGFWTSSFGLYLIAWAVTFSAFLLFVFVKAVILHEPARYFTALLCLSIAYILGGYIIVEGYERIQISRRVWDVRYAGVDLRTKFIMLTGIALGGMVVAGLVMALLLMAGRVWSPQSGMILPVGNNPAGNIPPGPGEPKQPPAAFVPGDGKPAQVRGEVPAIGKLPGLIAYWPFDEGDGDKAADASGNGNDGTIKGAKWIKGIRGKALWFHDQNVYFDYGSGPAFNFAAKATFSITGWIQTKAAVGTIVSQRHSKDGGPDIEISLNNGKLAALVREDGGEFGQAALLTGAPVHDGIWHHFALSRQAEGVVELFIDGKTQGKTSSPQSAGAITTDLRSVAREQYWLTVKPGPGWAHWNGCIDELAIFSRAVSEAEIQRLAGLAP